MDRSRVRCHPGRAVATLVALAALGLGVTPPASAQDPAPARGEGTEDRQWLEPGAPPESISPAQYQVTVQAAQIPMRDGTMLPAVLYLPQGMDAPGPCVFWAEGYSPPSALGPALTAVAATSFQDLATRGYAGAHVYLRGQAPAEEALYYKYAEDGYDITEWIATQPWCDGNVGMMGASLNGISQWLTAKMLPPHLKAIVPQIGCGDCYWYLWNKGGTLPGDGREGRTPPATAYDEYGAGSAHPDYDEWWDARNTDTADHEAIAEAGIAVLQCGGWDDYIHAGGMRAVEELTAAGGRGMHLIGPCAHGGETPELAPYDLQTHTVLWFDRHLKGIENGFGDTAAAVHYVQGANQYRYEPQWPIPDTRWARLHLREEASGSAVSLNDGSLSPEPPGAGEVGVSFEHSPEGPFNNAGGGTTRPAGDQRPDEEISLSWTTPPLTTPTEVTGWPKLTFSARIDGPDADFVAELTDVAPDGTSTTVGRGWLNARHALDRTAPPELVAGQVYDFTLELWPLSYVFQPEHRIRLDLAGSDSPGTAPNPNAATVTVLQDAEHPSALDLPIIGTALLPGEVLGPVRRVSGPSRIDTAAAVAREAYEEASSVVVARADVYADALAGAPLAHKLSAPLLLSDSAALSGAARTEVHRLGATSAVLLGGEAALSPQVEADLRDAGVTEITRVSGPDRFATSAAIAMRVGGTHAYVAKGIDADPRQGFADALAAAPLAAAAGRPILLTTTDSLPDATAAAVEALGVDAVTILGGRGAVSDEVEQELRATGVQTGRLAGATRYDTAAAVAAAAVAAGADPARPWVATGEAFPDALSAGPATAADGGVLVLVHGGDLASSPATRAFLAEHAANTEVLRIVGGRQAITPAVEADLRALLA